MTLQETDDGIDVGRGAPATDLPKAQARAQSRRRSRGPLPRRTRRVLIGALVVLLAGGGVAAWAVFFRDTGTAATYRTVTVASGTLKQTVSASGTLNPATESDLSFGSSGTVTQVLVEPGDLVKKGAELASIDDSELEIDYDSAKASLTEAKETLDELEDDDDATDSAIAAAEATVQVRKNAVTQAKTALGDATLVSPIAGKVAEVTIAEGDTVSGSASSTSSGTGSGTSGSGSGTTGATGTGGTADEAATSTSGSTPAVTVISDGTFTVDTSVSNADVTSIKKGLQATITATGSTDPVFGTVSSVGVVASSTSSTSASGSGSATFPVTVKVTGAHKDLLPGSSATVAITVKQLTDVISLPTQAVTTVDGKTVVQKLIDGKQVPTPVSLGASVGASTVVTSGLAVGDQVTVAGFRGAGTTGTGGGQGTGQGGGYGGAGAGPGAGGFPAQGQGQAPVQGQQQGSR